MKPYEMLVRSVVGQAATGAQIGSIGLNAIAYAVDEAIYVSAGGS
jgi:hypothetical protein